MRSRYGLFRGCAALLRALLGAMRRYFDTRRDATRARYGFAISPCPIASCLRYDDAGMMPLLPAATAAAAPDVAAVLTSV